MTIAQKWCFSLNVLIGPLMVFIFVDTTTTQNILQNGTQVFDWWVKPPVAPVINIYIYNVTNVDDFLNNGSKPVLDETGPYVYQEKWERVNITYNKNGTISYYLNKFYHFNENLSVGTEEDVVIVPNIPLLSATSQLKYSARFLRLAMASLVDILKIKPFLELSVGQLLWGYEDPMLTLAKDAIFPYQQGYPEEEFGLMYKRNETSNDKVSIFTGANDITKYGLIDLYNSTSHQTHWLTDKCNSLLASDGSFFPPHVTKNTTLYLYDKYLCRTLPLVFEQEIKRKDNISCWRFSPPTNVFDNVEKNPQNQCYCPGGPPCSPSGLFNVSLCRYGLSAMLSFPHFYLADDDFINAVEGISLPDPEKHKFYIDVQPDTGFVMSAKQRIQFNIAVSQIPDIKAVATFPEIVFPVFWFEESIDDLPEEITNFIATDGLPKRVLPPQEHLENN